MRRADRAQDTDFALALIDRCEFGVVAFSDGENAPYCLPLSMVRVDNQLYFHCALQGKKLDYLARNPRVCVSFVGENIASQDSFTTYFQSALVTGRATEIQDDTEKIEALRALSQKLTPANMVGDNFERAIAKSLSVTGVWRIEMDEVTAKAKFPPPNVSP